MARKCLFSMRTNHRRALGRLSRDSYTVAPIDFQSGDYWRRMIRLMIGDVIYMNSFRFSKQWVFWVFSRNVLLTTCCLVSCQNLLPTKQRRPCFCVRDSEKLILIDVASNYILRSSIFVYLVLNDQWLDHQHVNLKFSIKQPFDCCLG